MGGYIGDIARMAVAGPPSRGFEDLLDEVDAASDRSAPAVKNTGRQEDRSTKQRARRSHGCRTVKNDFEAHGVGLVSHEVPHLTGGNVPYPAPTRTGRCCRGWWLSIENEHSKNREAGS